MTTREILAEPRAGRRRRRSLPVLLVVLAVAATACSSDDDDATGGSTPAEASIDLRDDPGPHVEAPGRAMAMTVDAVEVDGDDILVRVRVENHDDGYLDLGVQDTIYGPLAVMHDDLRNRYEGEAVEPAGIPGRRLAELSFRLAGPLDGDAESFTLELATQRGPLTSPSGPLPDGRGVRWRVDAVDGEPTFAAAPRLPDLINFWLETRPLPSDH
jgi:hypothetical protein